MMYLVYIIGVYLHHQTIIKTQLIKRITKIIEIMNIPKAILKEWSDLREPGDNIALAQLTEKSLATISGVFNKGRCKQKDFVIIKAFYEERKKLFV